MVYLVTLGVIIILLPFVLWVAALNSTQATFIPDGQMKFVVTGENLHKVLLNVTGRIYDKDTGKIRKPLRYEERLNLLARRFGIFWVSILYPLRKVHKFKIGTAKLIPEKDRKGKPIHEWVQQGEKELDSFLWRFTTVFLAKDVELKDNFKLDLLIYTIFEVVNPYIPIFVYRGKFFEQIAAAVQGVAAAYGNDFETYSLFVENDHGKGGILTPLLLELNREMEEDGIVEQFGLRLVDGWVMSYDLSETDASIIAATKEEEKQRLIAKGVVAKSEGEATSIKNLGNAEKERVGAFIEGLREKGVSPDMAAKVLNSQVVMSGMQKTKITTWVEGGNSIISIQPDKKKVTSTEEE